MKASSSKLALRKQGIVLNDLDGNPNPQASLLQAAALQIEKNHHEGPIPSPQALSEYEEVLPGIADRIMSMAEKNAEHLRKKEQSLVDNHYQDKTSGRRYGFTLILIAFLVTWIAIERNMPYLAALIGGTTVLGIATIFILGKKANTKHNDNNSEEE